MASGIQAYDSSSDESDNGRLPLAGRTSQSGTGVKVVALNKTSVGSKRTRDEDLASLVQTDSHSKMLRTGTSYTSRTADQTGTRNEARPVSDGGLARAGRYTHGASKDTTQAASLVASENMAHSYIPPALATQPAVVTAVSRSGDHTLPRAGAAIGSSRSTRLGMPDAVALRMGDDAQAAHAALASLGISQEMAAGLDPLALRDLMKASGGGRRKGRLRAAQRGAGGAAGAGTGGGVTVRSVSQRQVHGQWSADDVAAIGAAPMPQRNIVSSAWDSENGTMTTIEGSGVDVGQRRRQNQLTMMASRAVQLETERMGPSAEVAARGARKVSRKNYGF